MNFAERAFRYLFRKKGKAIILFWVLLITETMILSTVTILRASEVARIELLGKSKAKLLIEREKAEELFTDDEYKKLEKLENVKAVNRVAEVQLYPMDFKIITKSESVDADNQKLRIMAYDSNLCESWKNKSRFVYADYFGMLFSIWIFYNNSSLYWRWGNLL